MNKYTESSQSSNAEEMLHLAESTTKKSASHAESPKGFTLVFSAYLASFFGIRGVIPDAIWYWLILLAVPLLVWYWNWYKSPARLGPEDKHSKGYILAMLVMVICMQSATMWVPNNAWLVAIKIMGLFIIIFGAQMIMRSETVKQRVRKALHYAN